MSKHLILMLEDDDDDRYITRQYFQNFSTQVDLNIVSSSEEVSAYLAKCKNDVEKFPDLLLLNYNSAPLNAVEVLINLKKDPALRSIPTVVLSGTVIPGIVKECYASGASSFIQKPALIKQTEEKIHSFLRYWFNTVSLP